MNDLFHEFNLPSKISKLRVDKLVFTTLLKFYVHHLMSQCHMSRETHQHRNEGKKSQYLYCPINHNERRSKT